jgi:hypothetical protein
MVVPKRSLLAVSLLWKHAVSKFLIKPQKSFMVSHSAFLICSVWDWSESHGYFQFKSVLVQVLISISLLRFFAIANIELSKPGNLRHKLGRILTIDREWVDILPPRLLSKLTCSIATKPHGILFSSACDVFELYLPLHLCYIYNWWLKNCYILSCFKQKLQNFKPLFRHQHMRCIFCHPLAKCIPVLMPLC